MKEIKDDFIAGLKTGLVYRQVKCSQMQKYTAELCAVCCVSIFCSDYVMAFLALNHYHGE